MTALDALPFPGIAARPSLTGGEQLTLIGVPQPARIPHHLWQQWLDDPHVVARFVAKRYRRRDHQCWPWLGAVSSTGHGSFRAAATSGAFTVHRSRRPCPTIEDATGMPFHGNAFNRDNRDG